MINWKVRLKNKVFWMTAVPAVFLMVQKVAEALGFALDLNATQTLVLQVIDAVFAVLAALGVVVDNTTKGIGDSTLAMSYTEPTKH